ncbi:MAG: DNA-3-methyladenine glycosylase I [Candidatus Eremiobacteraeota bacterium]|nr:DNA-3-methyladenine glycosylase I [Candidatus Eremiobacteraeota bacterium]
MQRYHDREWGVPVHSDRRLFEFLILEGAQAGLSWSTILRKRSGYRRAFANFHIARVAQFNAATMKRLAKDPSIVQNRLKIASTVNNARAALAIRREWGSLDRFLWHFVKGKPLQHAHKSSRALPSTSKEAQAMSVALREAGFTFVGPTICYAFMQAVGMVNDHTTSCFRWPEVRKLA